jgi:hypothetical protein
MIRTIFLSAALVAALFSSAQTPTIENDKPYATIGGYTNGATVNKTALAAQGGISVFVKSEKKTDITNTKPARQYKFTVTSYRATIIRKGQTVASHEVQGNVFTEKTKTALKTLESGDIVLISELKAVDKASSGGVENLPPLVYVIQ